MTDVNNNSPKHGNKSHEEVNAYERILRLLEYLKWNTHSGNTVSFSSLKEKRYYRRRKNLSCDDSCNGKGAQRG